MASESSKTSSTATLRKVADQNVKQKPAIENRNADVHKLLHELQVHQIELEMQNAELQQARTDLELSLARYTDLYDFAPVAYFTLDSDKVIVEANLSAADMLGIQRSSLIGQRLENFVASNSQPIFRNFLQKVFTGHAKEICEAALLNVDKQPRFAHITATVDIAGKTCRLVIVDVDERKKFEEALRQSQEELRQLASYQNRVKEDERKRIARDIHDDLGQNLLALRLDISTLHARTGELHPYLHDKVTMALTHIDATMKAVRSAINNLRPAVLDLGLNAAIEWQLQDFERRTGIACELAMENGNFALGDNRATALFRILQESLNNVARHAQANMVHIELRQAGNRLFMKIADDGIGIFANCRRKANAFGLIGIKERLLALGGELIIDSGPGKGTALTMSIPINDYS